MERREQTSELKAKALQLGFHAAGVCPAVSPTGISRLREWLEMGYAGQMDYIENRAEAYSHPRCVLEGVKSILVLTMNYRTKQPAIPSDGQGRVSCYAWGTLDYHDVIHAKLRELKRYALRLIPDCRARGVVDTAPLLEREFAQMAGLGWIGKNTLLLSREAGSWFFLAALLLDVELDYDQPFEADHCGSCRACLDACPTDAFPQPYVLDATRCISYLTIEHRDAMPHDLCTGVGDWIFGCDVCQEVCPWNNHAPDSSHAEFKPRGDLDPMRLDRLFSLTNEQFRTLYRRTPLWRAKRRGILRNAAIVLGNQQSLDSVSALRRGVTDEESLVRAASAWALGQYGLRQTREILSARLAVEQDLDVRKELLRSLA